MKSNPLVLMGGLMLLVLPIAKADFASSVLATIPQEKHAIIEEDKLTSVLREIDAGRQAGTKSSDALLARLDVALTEAHKHGVPLALLLYGQSPDDEQMRLKLAIEITRPDAPNKFGWESFDSLVEGFLAARDAPLNVFKGNPKQQVLDDLVRSSVLRMLVVIANPAKAETTFSSANASRLRHELTDALGNSQLQDGQRDLLKRAIDRVERFEAEPPAYLSPRWREAATQLQGAASKWGKTSEQPASLPTVNPAHPAAASQPTLTKKAPEAKPPISAPSEEPTSPTAWSIIVVIIGAALGLLWLLLKRRS